MAKIDRVAYTEMYGPTTGDCVRLGDTNLWVQVEKDHTVFGEETKFGGGKTVRDGMAQSQYFGDDVMDAVITNALVIDHWGIVKADVGIKNGRIAGIGKAGNPNTQSGVDLLIGPGTEIIDCENKILTAGAIDSHVHFICPQLAEEALMSGTTTLIGGGTGPATGSKATTCTPGAWNIHRMYQSIDSLPLNFGFTGKGNSSQPASTCSRKASG